MFQQGTMVPLPIDINIPHMEKFIQTRRSTNEGSSSERHDAKMEEMASSLVTKAAWRILVPRRFRNRHQLRHHGYFFDSNSGCHPPPSPPAPTEIAREHVMGLIPWLLQVLNVLLFVSILLLVSGGSYVLLYRSVMPSMLATVPLHFDYSAEPVVEKSLIATMMTSSPTTNNPLSFARRNNNSKQSRSPPQTPVTPTATVDLLAENGASWEALHEDVAPPLIRQNRLLHARQAYFMEIVLYVPESEHNRRAGLFGLTTHLQSSSSSNHTLLARSTRWTQLPHESGWISVSRKLLCLPAFWIGAMREFRTIPVLAFRHFVESRNHPVVCGVPRERHDAVFLTLAISYHNHLHFFSGPCTIALRDGRTTTTFVSTARGRGIRRRVAYWRGIQHMARDTQRMVLYRLFHWNTFVCLVLLLHVDVSPFHVATNGFVSIVVRLGGT